MRDVYPGFLQLSGFMTMNLDRHTDAHKALFNNLVKGDGDMVDKHREFYDEYLAVMDLTAEYYLQTVDVVFVKHALPKGRDDASRQAGRSVANPARGVDDGRRREGRHLRPRSNRSNAFTMSRDSRSSSRSLRAKGVGHYGVFNGSRFRSEIVPRISDFMMSAANMPRRAAIPTENGPRSRLNNTIGLPIPLPGKFAESD